MRTIYHFMEEKNEIDIKEEDLKEEDFTPEELEAKDVDWKAKAQELKGIAKRRATQLGKIKEKLNEYETKLKEFEDKLPKNEPEPQDKQKPNEPDYGRLAFLQSKGIDHPDDIKIVQEEAERLKLPLTDVLGMEHMQAKLKANREEREAKAGMPKGSGRAGGTTQHDVDYWLSKGGLPDDQELAEKVIEARMNKEKQNKFSDELYVG
jgi:hypothetical protein